MSNLQKMYISLLTTIVLCGSMTILVYCIDKYREYFPFVFILFFVGVVTAREFWLAHKRNQFLVIEKESSLRQDSTNKSYLDGVEEKWFVRYPLAIFLVVAAYYLASQKTNLIWLSVVCVCSAIYYARELAVVIVIACLAYFLFNGIASLPTSAAIIIGAIIIAAALQKK